MCESITLYYASSYVEPDLMWVKGNTLCYVPIYGARSCLGQLVALYVLHSNIYGTRVLLTNITTLGILCLGDQNKSK